MRNPLQTQPRSHPTRDDAAETALRLVRWFRAHARSLPWRHTTDPYAIWVSEIMLQQTQVQTVIPYWTRWMRRFPTLASLASAQESDILKAWEGLGYYRRVRNLHRAAILLVQQGQTRPPPTVRELLELPGVGRYTAGAIASIAYDQPEPILDGNVTRVLARLHGIRGDPALRPVLSRLWLLATQLVTAAAHLKSPKGRPCSDLNQALMELGATVCLPRNPECHRCPIQSLCHAHRIGAPAQFPELPPRAKAVARQFLSVAIQHADAWWLQRRTEEGVNAGFWEFPRLEQPVPPADSPEQRLASHLQIRDSRRLRPLVVIRHAITRYRIVDQVFTLQLTAPPKPAFGQRLLTRFGPASEGGWFNLDQISALPLTAAHRKVADKLRSGGSTSQTT